ncbi:MAG: carboxypeptidase-like regulatory domain-containing protein [Isosphaeraceae bacterium]|nr:carboxypeptidase-like regulatory domain-containing protein [Isosphaeraceae bacterium]
MKPRPFAVATLAAALLAGCGEGDETASYTLVPVSGTVRLDGKPLEGAQVSFTPDPGNKPSTPGSDLTGPDGNYKVMFRGRSGVAPGKYKVAINKTNSPTTSKNLPEVLKDDPTMFQIVLEAKAGARTVTKTGAPVTKIDDTFDQEVDAKGGVIDFDIKAKPSSKAPRSTK